MRCFHWPFPTLPCQGTPDAIIHLVDEATAEPLVCELETMSLGRKKSATCNSTGIFNWHFLSGLIIGNGFKFQTIFRVFTLKIAESFQFLCVLSLNEWISKKKPGRKFPKFSNQKWVRFQTNLGPRFFRFNPESWCFCQHDTVDGSEIRRSPVEG